MNAGVTGERVLIEIITEDIGVRSVEREEGGRDSPSICTAKTIFLFSKEGQDFL